MGTIFVASSTCRLSTSRLFLIALCMIILFFTLYAVFRDTPIILKTTFRVTSAFSQSLSDLLFWSNKWAKFSEKKLNMLLSTITFMLVVKNGVLLAEK